MPSARIVTVAFAGAAALAALVWALWPEPAPVDLAGVRSAPMEVTVEAEGVTSLREPWQITAPVTGMAQRSPVEVGDDVTAGETVVAVIEPAEPAFLDARAQRQAEAAVDEAEAALRLAQVSIERASAALDYATAQYSRDQALAERGTIPQRVLEDSRQRVTTARNELEAARREADLRRAALARAQAQLVGTAGRVPHPDSECCARITAPGDGTVLSVANVSARLVQAGEPLLTIGDLDGLEIVAEVLSADAVRLSQGAEARVTGWGGDGTLAARVRRIEPAAFTKVSALGIEEQRVRVHLELLTPPARRAGLGENFRVLVEIVTWRGDSVLQVPISALFRDDGGWAVFAAQEGRARLRQVEIGRRTRESVQIIDGLASGETVIAFPDDRIEDGVRIVQRERD